MKKIVSFLILTFCMLALLSVGASAQADMGLGTGIFSGELIVPIETSYTWVIIIDISTEDNLNGVVVQGGIGADLVITQVNGEFVDFPMGKKTSQSKDNVTLNKKGGNMGATIVTWDIGDLNAGESDTLYLTVQTWINPQEKQEFTSVGIHELDGGFSATYWFGDIEYETEETIPLTVEAVEE